MKDRELAIFEILEKLYPDAKIALDYDSDFHLLVAVILSAQCTDVRVNKVTPVLFAKYPGIKDFAEADIEELKKLIYTTGFYNNKAKNIIGAAKAILSEYNGKIPKTISEFSKIPGVARKTANVVLSEVYGICEGITVDTHVIRLSGRLGFCEQKLADKKNAVKIEEALMNIFPKKLWCKLPHLLILHGRKVCTAKNPKCGECAVNKLCPYYKNPIRK